jgi:hemerythrin HHE cation binding domain-containing protein
MDHSRRRPFLVAVAAWSFPSAGNTSPSGMEGGAMAKDAVTLLKEDHKKMKKIMSDIHSTTERGVKTREELIEKMRGELKIHERIEEEIFYPALRKHKKAKEIVLEGYAEHHAVDVLLDELDGVPFDDETWGAKFNVIKENIEHHIEEEEGDMFKKATQVFDDGEVEDLGEGMARLKDQLQSSFT